MLEKYKFFVTPFGVIPTIRCALYHLFFMDFWVAYGYAIVRNRGCQTNFANIFGFSRPAPVPNYFELSIMIIDTDKFTKKDNTHEEQEEGCKEE